MADPLPGVCFVLPGEQLPGGGAAAVGNKAWNLMLMAGIGLNVPPAFVLPTAWYARGVAPDDPALRRVTGRGASSASRPKAQAAPGTLACRDFPRNS